MPTCLPEASALLTLVRIYRLTWRNALKSGGDKKCYSINCGQTLFFRFCNSASYVLEIRSLWSSNAFLLCSFKFFISCASWRSWTSLRLHDKFATNKIDCPLSMNPLPWRLWIDSSIQDFEFVRWVSVCLLQCHRRVHRGSNVVPSKSPKPWFSVHFNHNAKLHIQGYVYDKVSPACTPFPGLSTVKFHRRTIFSSTPIRFAIFLLLVFSIDPCLDEFSPPTPLFPLQPSRIGTQICQSFKC